MEINKTEEEPSITMYWPRQKSQRQDLLILIEQSSHPFQKISLFLSYKYDDHGQTAPSFHSTKMTQSNLSYHWEQINLSHYEKYNYSKNAN